MLGQAWRRLLSDFRTGGKIDRGWSADMSALLGKESRPHMRGFLAGQGFTFE